MTIVQPTVGLVDGVVVGVLAALLTAPLSVHLLPETTAPTELFWSKFVGSGPPSEYATEGAVLHLLTGALAGAALAWLAPAYPLGWPSGEPLRASVLGAVANGVTFGLVLSVDALAVVSGPLDVDVDYRTVAVLVVFHVAWGTAAGVFLGIHLA